MFRRNFHAAPFRITKVFHKEINHVTVGHRLFGNRFNRSGFGIWRDRGIIRGGRKDSVCCFSNSRDCVVCLQRSERGPILGLAAV
jgi:hypothetical protein